MDCWNWKGLAPRETVADALSAAKGSGFDAGGAVEDGRGVEDAGGEAKADRLLLLPPKVFGAGGAGECPNILVICALERCGCDGGGGEVSPFAGIPPPPSDKAPPCP